MAGHSHWAGIKHKKGRADKERSKIFSKLSREITKSTEQNTVALGRSGQLSKQILQDDTNLEAAKRELAISTIGVKQEEIDAAKLLQSVNNQIIGQQKELEELEQSMLDMNEKELEVALERKKKIIEQNADLEGQRGFILETASKETERIAFAPSLDLLFVPSSLIIFSSISSVSYTHLTLPTICSV